jgi:NAD(P)-dependent dehydrogenase (short-subunit alcohol dehydrogenase family)
VRPSPIGLNRSKGEHFLRLQDKVAIVTVAIAGIDEGIAILLACEGAKVLVVVRKTRWARGLPQSVQQDRAGRVFWKAGGYRVGRGLPRLR